MVIQLSEKVPPIGPCLDVPFICGEVVCGPYCLRFKLMLDIINACRQTYMRLSPKKGKKIDVEGILWGSISISREALSFVHLSM